MATSPKSKKQLFAFLAPLIAFGVVLLAVFGYFQHKKMLERTKISFVTTVPTPNPMYQTAAWLDGKPVVNGEKITLGSHTFKITNPKAETFEANFFAWYGGKNFGVIALKRSTGTLNIHSDIPALSVLVRGPEFSALLTNVTESNLTVPTDDYDISADYPHRWVQKQKATVNAAQKAVCVLAPAFGTLHATANRDGETYELWDDNGHFIEGGNLPVTVTDLAVGQYRLTAKWHSHSADRTVMVKKGETCEMPVDFNFGAAIFRTTPAGAAVLSANGTQLGNTPLMVTEVPPGPVEYRLKLDGYNDVSVALTVAADQTNDVTTNLTSLAYLSGMQKARNYISAAEYHGALDGVNQALEAKPGDPDATALLKTIRCRAAVLEAKRLAVANDFAGAGKQLQIALTEIPDDAEAKALATQYKAHEGEQQAEAAEKRTPDFLNDWCEKNPQAKLFDTVTYTTAKLAPAAACDALVQACTEQWPKLKLAKRQNGGDDPYLLLFVQRAENPEITHMRDLVMVIGKDKTGKTLILGKAIEFQFLQGSGWTPVHSSRMQITFDLQNQINEGVLMLSKKIKVAIGETD